jgi:hypothetical protein
MPERCSGVLVLGDMCMCTQTSPDRHSISVSARALGEAILAALRAAGALIVATLTAPTRGMRNGRPRPVSVNHVDVQILLVDRHCIRELNRTLAKTLCRAARIWAPLKLPVDRIVVGAGFPAEGRADIYEDFVGLVGEGITAKGDPPPTRLVVISLGLRSGERDLEPSEVSGALAVQIQRLVDDLSSKHRTVGTPAVDTGPAAVTQGDSSAAPRTSRLARSTPAAEPRRVTRDATEEVQGLAAGGGSLTDRNSMSPVPSLQELLATVQEGQPLTAAGPATQTTNP